MALDAAKGMLHLHSQNPPVLHRDLKSANLMVDKHWNVKVADFNLAKMKSGDEPTALTLSSTAALNPRCGAYLGIAQYLDV
jgi:serine/threonine protein kinase